jgi:hypothetical protein
VIIRGMCGKIKFYYHTRKHSSDPRVVYTGHSYIVTYISRVSALSAGKVLREREDY